MSYNYIKGNIQVHYESSESSEIMARSSIDDDASDIVKDEEMKLKAELEQIKEAIKVEDEQIKLLESHPKLKELEKAQKALKSLEKSKKLEHSKIERKTKEWIKKTKEMEKYEKNIIGELEQEKKSLKSEISSLDSNWSDREIQKLMEEKENILKTLNQELEDEEIKHQEIDEALKVEERELVQAQRKFQKDLIQWKKQQEVCGKQDGEQIEKVKRESKRWLKDLKGLKFDLEQKVEDLKNKIREERDKSEGIWAKSEQEEAKRLHELTNSILDERLLEIRQTSKLHGEMTYLEESRKTLEELALEVPMMAEKESNQVNEMSRKLLDQAQEAVEQLEERKTSLLQDLDQTKANTEERVAALKKGHAESMDQLQNELQKGLDTIKDLEAEQVRFQQMRRNRDDIRDELRLNQSQIDELKANYDNLKHDRMNKAHNLLTKTKSALEKIQKTESDQFKSTKARLEQIRSKQIREVCRVWENKSGTDFAVDQEQILEQRRQEFQEELQGLTRKEPQQLFDQGLVMELQNIKDLDAKLVETQTQLVSLEDHSRELVKKWTDMKMDADKAFQEWENQQNGEPVQIMDNPSQSESPTSSDDSSLNQSKKASCCCFWK